MSIKLYDKQQHVAHYGCQLQIPGIELRGMAATTYTGLFPCKLIKTKSYWRLVPHTLATLEVLTSHMWRAAALLAQI